MAKIPFDIKYRPQIESGEYKVETRSGRPVRIVCWDKIGVPIVALVGDADDIVTYNRDGTTGQQMKLPSDLFIITPESQLSEMEVHLLSWLSDDTKGEIQMDRMKEVVRNRASELLELAKKELKKKFVLNPIDDHLAAFDMGKAEALRNLPKWRYATKNLSADVLRMDEDGTIFIDFNVFRGEYYIPLSELRKLPKEE